MPTIGASALRCAGVVALYAISMACLGYAPDVRRWSVVRCLSSLWACGSGSVGSSLLWESL